MLGYLLMLLYSVLNILESMVVKAYAVRHKSGGMVMNAVIAFFSALFILFTIIKEGRFNVPLEMLPYAIVNCLLYAAGFYFAFLAYRVGPYGLTRLLSTFSLLFPIFYGIFFLSEPTNVFTYLGIAMIFASMILLNCSDSKNDEGKISLKWLIYIAITVLSNGFISILVKMQQLKFNNACDNEFLLISIGGSFVLLAIIGLIMDRDKIGTVLRKGTLYGLLAGLCNGAKNFVSVLVLLLLPVSVVSPTKVGISTVLTFVVAILIYRERYSIWQKIGVLLGAVAVVLLAL